MPRGLENEETAVMEEIRSLQQKTAQPGANGTGHSSSPPESTPSVEFVDPNLKQGTILSQSPIPAPTPAVADEKKKEDELNATRGELGRYRKFETEVNSKFSELQTALSAITDKLSMVGVQPSQPPLPAKPPTIDIEEVKSWLSEDERDLMDEATLKAAVKLANHQAKQLWDSQYAPQIKAIDERVVELQKNVSATRAQQLEDYLLMKIPSLYDEMEKPAFKTWAAQRDPGYIETREQYMQGLIRRNDPNAFITFFQRYKSEQPRAEHLQAPDVEHQPQFNRSYPPQSYSQVPQQQQYHNQRSQPDIPPYTPQNLPLPRLPQQQPNTSMNPMEYFQNSAIPQQGNMAQVPPSQFNGKPVYTAQEIQQNYDYATTYRLRNKTDPPGWESTELDMRRALSEGRVIG